MKRWVLSAPEILFLAGSLVGGIGYLVLFPPLTVADEPGHFYRAFAITTGQLQAECHEQCGARLPVSLTRVEPAFGGGSRLLLHPEWRVHPSQIRSALQWPLLAGDRTFVAFPTAALYPAVVHMPQALGVGAGRLLGLGPVPLIYFGRLSNLLLCTLLTWFAIRTTPLGRWGLCWLALTPMALSSRASLSADALTTAAAFLLAAAVARLAWAEREPTTGDRVLVVVAALLVCLSKAPYVPLLLTLLVVPGERLALRAHRRFWLLAAGLAVAAVAYSTWVGWSFGANLGAGAAVDRNRQVSDALAEPLRFLGIVGREFISNGRWYVAEMIGVWLGWMDVVVPIAVCWGYLVVFAGLLLLAGTPRAQVLWGQRLVLGGVIALLLLLIAASQYAIWTAYRADFIRMQGRYLLPIAPLVVLALHRRPRREPRAVRLAVALGLAHLAITAAVWAQIIERYYG